MNSDFQNLIDHIREKSNNDTELGQSFEQISKVFFENDLIQQQQFSQIWHYKDWARLHSEYSSKDIGIDLVGELKDEDGFCAIQCKCYESNHTIAKADIDSFISASSTSDFKRLILIDTSFQNLGENAQKVINNLDKEYIRIQQNEFENSNIDWERYLNANQEIKFKRKKLLRDDQEYVVDKVLKEFETNDRGKIIMACGTGKTFTSLKIAEKMPNKGKLILFMVPSLALMSQVIRDWKNDAEKEFIAFSACSDKKVGNKKNFIIY